jgi:hypothetical protein
MLLPDVLLADEDQVTRSEHAGATAPRAFSCVSVRQPTALRPAPKQPPFPSPPAPGSWSWAASFGWGLLRALALDAASRARRRL